VEGGLMLKNLTIHKSLAFWDLETTGGNVYDDRIVEIGIIVLHPDGSEVEYLQRVNPIVAIQPGATEVHGITNEDVKDAPTFAAIAQDVVNLLYHPDWAGFGLRRYDIPLLLKEFARLGFDFPLGNRIILDASSIFYSREPRNLAGALKFYCGEELTDAHTAAGDTRAAMKVLDAQLARYDDLPKDLTELSLVGVDTKNVDFDGKFIRDPTGEIIFNFSKQKGKKLSDVAKDDAGFLQWMLQQDFMPDTKEIVRRALANDFMPLLIPAQS